MPRFPGEKNVVNCKCVEMVDKSDSLLYIFIRARVHPRSQAHLYSHNLLCSSRPEKWRCRSQLDALHPLVETSLEIAFLRRLVKRQRWDTPAKRGFTCGSVRTALSFRKRGSWLLLLGGTLGRLEEGRTRGPSACCQLWRGPSETVLSERAGAASDISLQYRAVFLPPPACGRPLCRD